MIFKEKLISGEFIKRYKRFFVDIKIGNNVVTAHCPNTGSMMGLLKKGNKVWLSKSDNPKRKLKYTLQIIKSGSAKVGVNTHLTNKIVFDALKSGIVKNFKKSITIKQEVKFGKNTRFDFLVSENNKKCFIEVKNVTLSRERNLSEFPDAITSRGLKHIKELLKAKKKGFQIYLFYVIQRDDCKEFRIAKDIDNEYYENYKLAKKSGVKFIAYNCKVGSKEIKIDKKIKILDE